MAAGRNGSGCLSTDTLALFLDGRLEGPERTNAERHLAACAQCFELLAIAGPAMGGASAAGASPGAPTLVLTPRPAVAPTPSEDDTRPLPTLAPITQARNAAATTSSPRRRWIGYAVAASGLGVLAAAAWIALRKDGPTESSQAHERSEAKAGGAPAAAAPSPAVAQLPMRRPSAPATAQQPPAPPPPPADAPPSDAALPSVSAPTEPAAPKQVQEVPDELATPVLVSQVPPQSRSALRGTPPGPDASGAEQGGDAASDLSSEGTAESTPAPSDAAPPAVAAAASPDENPQPAPAPVTAAAGRLGVLLGAAKLQADEKAAPVAAQIDAPLDAGTILRVSGGFAGVDTQAGAFLTAGGAGGGTTLRVKQNADGVQWVLDRGTLYLEVEAEASPVQLVTPQATVTVDPGEVQVTASPTQTVVNVAAGEATVAGAKGGERRLTAGQKAGVTAAALQVLREPKPPIPDWVMAARLRRLEKALDAALPKGTPPVDRARILQSLGLVVRRGYPLPPVASLVAKAATAGVNGKDLAEIARGLQQAVERRRDALAMRDQVLDLVSAGKRGRELERAIRELVEDLPDIMDSIVRPGAEPRAGGGREGTEGMPEGNGEPRDGHRRPGPGSRPPETDGASKPPPPPDAPPPPPAGDRRLPGKLPGVLPKLQR